MQVFDVDWVSILVLEHILVCLLDILKLLFLIGLLFVLFVSKYVVL